MNPAPRAILITGCSSGIGECVALALQRRGYRVFASARQPTDVARITAQGLEAVCLDLDDSDSIRAAVATVLSRTNGQLHGLINNGGFGLAGAAEDLSRAALRAQFETNFFGPAELTNRVIPVMRAQGHGRLVQISSLLGLAAMPYRGAYTASKFALEGFSDTLRLELHGSGIEVCLIEPGPINTRFRANSLRAFLRYIDPVAHHSVHREPYHAVRARLSGPPTPYTLPPEALLPPIIHALEHPRPKARYPITLPSHLVSILRRVLPTRSLDWVLLRMGGKGKR